ncbi:hypothetical protein D5086_032203 [Populus alba]|uniref:Uncharacterized protein n=1 Tax=Populus alba TaxID=43335 RepID=A0ACC4AKN3_POPAL
MPTASMLSDITHDVLGLKRRKLPRPPAKQTTSMKASVVVIAKQNTSCFGEIKKSLGDIVGGAPVSMNTLPLEVVPDEL